MNYAVENRPLDPRLPWTRIAEFLWRMDANDFVLSMVSTRGYDPANFRVVAR